MTIATSACETVSVVVEELFSVLGSLSAETVAVFVKFVPVAVPAGTFPTSVNVVVPETFSEAMLQLMVPPAPTAGVVHEKVCAPLCDSETKVIVPGSVSASATFVAAFGPPLVTVIVYVTSPPGAAELGPFLTTATSPVGGGGTWVVATP